MQTIRGIRSAVRKTVALAGPGPCLVALCVATLSSALAGGTAWAAGSTGGSVAYWGRGHLSPVTEQLPAPIAEVGTSNSDLYALLTNGTVWAWGYGSEGELGDGSTGYSSTPVQVKFPAGVTIASIPVNSMPWDTAYAIDTTGHVWGWGANRGGEMCLGSSTSHDLPVELPLTDVTAVAGADQHTTYDAGGTLYSCGQNNDGELGDGTTKHSSVPVQVTGLTGQVTALVSGFNNIGVLLSTGAYYDWGYNGGGQLGNGTEGTSALVPAQVTLPGPVTLVAQGGNDYKDGQTLVMLTNGDVYAWGTNESGQLGTGNLLKHLSPVQIYPPSGVTYESLASGASTSYAVSTTGDVYAWGNNGAGEIGNGTKTPSKTPVKVETGATGLLSSTSTLVEVGHAPTRQPDTVSESNLRQVAS
jgi:alpha-tubulin suppressor-like RCC1 family protein